MNNKRIEVKYGKTINTGNYENEKIEVGISFDIEEQDNPESCLQMAWKIVKKFVGLKEEEILSRR